MALHRALTAPSHSWSTLIAALPAQRAQQGKAQTLTGPAALRVHLANILPTVCVKSALSGMW
jgi:hypothetical protein